MKIYIFYRQAAIQKSYYLCEHFECNDNPSMTTEYDDRVNNFGLNT